MFTCNFCNLINNVISSVIHAKNTTSNITNCYIYYILNIYLFFKTVAYIDLCVLICTRCAGCTHGADGADRGLLGRQESQPWGKDFCLGLPSLNPEGIEESVANGDTEPSSMGGKLKGLIE